VDADSVLWLGGQIVTGQPKGTLRLAATAKETPAVRTLPTRAALRVPCAAEAEAASCLPNDVPAPEEALVTDRRAGLTPSEQVEQKLLSLLKSNPVRVSHVQMIATGLTRGRK
jgi:hypothetical protein